MSTATKRHLGRCPIAFGTDVFGDRWTLLVLRDMLLHDKRTYGEFLDSDEAIATNILAARLRHLEAEGIVEKNRDPKNRRSFIYTLTEKGLALAPIIFEIIRWSGQYIPLNKARKNLLARIETDPDALLAEIQMRARKAK